MTPRKPCASQPNVCKPTRCPSAAVRQPVPRRATTAGWNAHGGALCHKPSPRRTRRHDPSSNCLRRLSHLSSPWPHSQKFIFSLVCALLFLCQSVQAGLHGSSIFERELVYDRRPVPKPRMGIYARQDDSTSSSTVSTGSGDIPPPSSTSSVSETIETATAISTSLPRPFDASLSGNNFTEPSCPQFFHDFLTNTTFQECLPFSLLLQVTTHSRSSCLTPTSTPLT